MAEAPTTPTTPTQPNAAPAAVSPPEAVNLLFPATPAEGASTPAVAAPATEGAAQPSPAPDPAPAEAVASEADEAPTLIAPKDATAEEPAAKEADATPTEPLTAASYEIKLPETVTLDETLLTEAKETFAKLGLDPKSAQPLADFYVKALEAQNAANLKAWNDQDSGWRNELHALPEFASVAQRKEAQTMIGRLLEDYGAPGLDAVIFNAGLGNNPQLAPFFLKLAKVLTEGSPGRPGGAVPQSNNGRIPKNATPGQILYETGGSGSAPTQQ